MNTHRFLWRKSKIIHLLSNTQSVVTVIIISANVMMSIPSVYEVYRGYIVFAFSVTMFVCVCFCV